MRLCCSTDRDHGSLKDAAGVVAASITTRRIIAPARESRAILTSPPVNCSRSILWAWPRLVFFDGFGSRRAAAVCLCCKSAQAMDKPPVLLARAERLGFLFQETPLQALTLAPLAQNYKARQESRAGGLGPVAHRNSYKACSRLLGFWPGRVLPPGVRY